MMLVVLPLAQPVAAQDVTGTWIPVELTADALNQQPQNARVLAIRREGGAFVGRLIIPTQGGLPLAVEQSGDRVHLVISMARGMETPLRRHGHGRSPERSRRAGSQQPQTVLRRPSDEERHVLERLAPKKLPMPAMKALPPNGLARTPPMGFSTWNHFQTTIDDRTIRERRRRPGLDRHARRRLRVRQHRRRLAGRARRARRDPCEREVPRHEGARRSSARARA